MNFGLIGLIFVFSESSRAYVQYSLQNNISSCTACHFSQVGGGPKNLNGKLYGAHTFRANPSLAQSYFSADLRVLYYQPEKSKTSKSGMGLMNGTVAGHTHLDEDGRIFLMLEHNVLGFASVPYRDTYGLFRLRRTPGWLETIMIGRFRVPFGIVTDEHRTYTRIQTNTEWYTLETGALLSGNPYESVHLDLGVFNGSEFAGQSLNTGQAPQWELLGNVRWLKSPFMLGASGRKGAWSTYAGATYRAFTLLLEHAQAKARNRALARGFVGNAGYGESIMKSHSQGWLAWLEWAYNHRFALIYKFDLLIPDRDYKADNYERHGLGFRWAIGPGVLIHARGEWARATHPSEDEGIGTGRQSAGWALLQFEL